MKNNVLPNAHKVHIPPINNAYLAQITAKNAKIPQLVNNAHRISSNIIKLQNKLYVLINALKNIMYMSKRIFVEDVERIV